MKKMKALVCLSVFASAVSVTWNNQSNNIVKQWEQSPGAWSQILRLCMGFSSSNRDESAGCYGETPVGFMVMTCKQSRSRCRRQQTVRPHHIVDLCDISTAVITGVEINSAKIPAAFVQVVTAHYCYRLDMVE